MSEPKLMANGCPFCKSRQSEDNGYYFIAHEADCFFVMHNSTHNSTQETVFTKRSLKAWNTRHSATEGWQIIRTAPMLKPVIVWEPEFYQGKGTALLGIQMRDGTWRAVPNSFQIVPSHWMPLPTETAPAVKQSFTVQEGEQSKP